MSSTWPTGLFTSGPSSPHLTIDQANSIFKLAAECQVLGVKLAKQFQVLSGLEAMHHNSIQGMPHETLTLGHSAQEATYLAILWDGVSEAEHKAMTCCLPSEADATWKEMHEVMYNHQLHYDQQLSTFLTDTETTLNNMRGEIWATICTLAENEGITFNACLGLTLQVLNLLLQIPIDISFQTQIPLTIAYCLESSIYRRWHPEQGSVSPLHKEVRAFHTLSKVLSGVTCQPSEGMDHPPSPAASDNSVGSGGSQGSRRQSRSRAQSITCGSVGLVAGCHSVHSNATKVARCQAVNPNSPTMRKTSLVKMKMPKQTRAGLRLQAIARWHQMVKKGRNILILKTPSTALARSLVHMRTQTHSLTLRRKSSPSGKSSTQKAPRRTAPLESPANHLRKHRQWMRHSTMRPGKMFGCWTHVLMLDIAKRLLKVSRAGPPETP